MSQNIVIDNQGYSYYPPQSHGGLDVSRILVSASKNRGGANDEYDEDEEGKHPIVNMSTLSNTNQ